MPLQRLVAVALLVAAAPLMAAVALAVRVRLGRPMVFRHERLGRDHRPFTMLKFRTMTDERDPATGDLLPDDARLTSLGRWLRSSSLDELPELWNVVRGEMALVGPRPLPARYADRYSADEARRHDVLPGLTGWAQVNGRNSISWDERLALDVWYVDNRSARLDVAILARTISTVLRRRDISGGGTATMTEFRPPA
jgi:lipopolysaccharide/colanic/teichoic acid biosynthesis glycosyltransferase